MISDISAIQLELGGTAEYACPCCGKHSETVHGFVYDEHGATTVYFAGYAHGHEHRRVDFALSKGAWGEGATPEDRRCVALVGWIDRAGGISYEFPPIESSPWYGETFLRQMMLPDELSYECRMQYKMLVGVVIERDPRVTAYLKDG